VAGYSGHNGCRKLSELDLLPEVIFASNNRMAQVANNALKAVGLKIHDDAILNNKVKLI